MNVVARWIIPVVVLFLLMVPVEIVFQHIAYRTSGWDLGIYHQALSKLSRLDEINPSISVHGMRIFNDHFDPILIFVAPILWIWDDALMLILIDTIATLAGLVPLVLIARRRVANLNSEFLSYRFLLVVVGYLFNDFIWKAHFFPSHPTHWEVTFLAWMLYFYEMERFGAGFWVHWSA